MMARARGSLAVGAAAPPAHRSGQARLSAWIRSRVAGDRVVALEEALLGGAFWRFALRRLWVFLFARGWATALHVLELTFLAEIFYARPFVASLALQNATLIIDAFWWGALEALRRRIRAIGVRTDARALTARYMTVALLAGLGGCGVPLARAAARWRAGAAPTMLDAYALVCLLRLALDMVLRAFYSGVYAYGRVHRPAWAAPLAPTILVGLTVALWPWLAGWSFVASLLVSVLCSRALLWRFTLRAYRLTRVPLPGWRWRWRLGLPGRGVDWRLLGESTLAGTANLTTRLASVVMLGAVLPSLGTDDPEAQLLAFVLHLAAPLVLITSQWSFIFYHDWKRLEADTAAVLAHQLHRGLLAVGVCIAALAWGVTVLLVSGFAGWRWAPVGTALLALAPTYLGLSIWTALQLRGFSRGEFVSQALSAIVVVGAVAVGGVVAARGNSDIGGGAAAAIADPRVWYWTLAGCPWLAVVAHGVLARWVRAPSALAPVTLDGWVHRLGLRRGPVVVWRARLAGPRAGAIAEEVGRLFARRGQVVAWRGWLFAYDARAVHGLRVGRDEWVARCAGLLASLEMHRAPTGARAAEELVRLGWLAPPAPGLDAGTLAQEHARLFPEGFVLQVGRRAPAVFVALPAEVRQAIWRDAIRRTTGARRQASAASPVWRVTAFAPRGALTHVFVRPRLAAGSTGGARPVGVAPQDPPAEQVWATRLRQSAWRVPAGGEAAPPDTHSDTHSDTHPDTHSELG